MSKLVVSGEWINIVRSLSHGLTVQEISEMKGISKRTLEGVVDRMRLKFGLKNIAHLVAFFLRNKLIK